MSSGFIKKYMTVPEVAEYFSLSRSYVYDLVQRGKLKAWHPDKVVGSKGLRVAVESVKALEEQGAMNKEQWME